MRPHTAICPLYRTSSKSNPSTEIHYNHNNSINFIPSTLDNLIPVARGLLVNANLVSRGLSFWTRVLNIYLGFKWTQARIKLHNNQDARKLWETRHKIAAQQMWELCIDLRGFYIKAGQFLATRYDFIPSIICKKLSGLMDNVPGMDKETVERILCKELNVKEVGDVFQSIDTEKYIGSASVAQVHKGVLYDGSEVAVKVQHEGAERLMLSDIGNFRGLAQFLQRTELKFDLTSPVEELHAQLRYEFDFVREANMMDNIGRSLGSSSGVHGVSIPRSIPRLVTRRVLVMTFLPGLPLTQLEAHLTKRSKRATRIVGRKILKRMASAYGEMILNNGRFQCDPHPGNILLNDQLDIGLLDFGQVKVLRNKDRRNFARLVLAIARRDARMVKKTFKKLGIKVERKQDKGEGAKRLKKKTVSKRVNVRRRFFMVPFRRRQRRAYTMMEKLAYTMFDTRELEGVPNSPFDKSSVMKEAVVKQFPKELFFLMRTIQIMRGLAIGMDNADFSLIDAWKPIAAKVVER